MNNNFYSTEEIKNLILIAAAKSMAYHNGKKEVDVVEFTSLLFEQFEITS